MNQASPPPDWWRPVWVCACGGQTLPIVLPMLPYPPQKVFLLHSPQSEPQAGLILKLLKTKGVGDVSTICADAYDFGAITRAVGRAVEGIKPETIIANWTGGTKPMAVALLGAVPKAVKLYFEVGRGIAINAGSFQALPETSRRLTIRDLSIIGGAVFAPPEAAPCRGPETISAIESMARTDARNLLRLQQAKRRGPNAKNKDLMAVGTVFSGSDLQFIGQGHFGQFADALVADRLAENRAGGRYCLNNSGVGFLSGFWWEQYVTRALHGALKTLGLPHGPDLLKENLKVKWAVENGGAPGQNEIDTAFLLRDRLCIVTSGSVKTPAEAKRKRDEALSIARRLGGSFSRVIVATLLQPGQLELVRSGYPRREVLVPHCSEWIHPENILRPWLG